MENFIPSKYPAKTAGYPKRVDTRRFLAYNVRKWKEALGL